MSYLSIYNQWLSFRAAKDLFTMGSVEHLDFDEIINNNFKDYTVIHKERRNFGMTYVFILQKPE